MKNILILLASLWIFPLIVHADCVNNFVRWDVLQTYLKKNPYIIANYDVIDGQSSYLFKVDHVSFEDESDKLILSGPVILIWNENPGMQPTYKLPDTGQIYTDELCGNYHYGYYQPMRAALPLLNLFSPAGGTSISGCAFMAFPDPELIPVEKGYAAWMEQLPEVVKEYCAWWYEKASQGPPVLYDLIDSVLSLPEGGSKRPPEIFTDYNHCPGEGYQYGEWKTSETIPFFDQPKSTKRLGTLLAGEEFTAITGHVYLRPVEKIVSEPFEVYDSTGSMLLESGRRYYILSNIGEGHSKVWVNGRIMISSDLAYNSSQEWWVEIITKKGKHGWISYPDQGGITGNDYLE